MTGIGLEKSVHYLQPPLLPSHPGWSLRSQLLVPQRCTVWTLCWKALCDRDGDGECYTISDSLRKQVLSLLTSNSYVEKTSEWPDCTGAGVNYEFPMYFLMRIKYLISKCFWLISFFLNLGTSDLYSQSDIWANIRLGVVINKLHTLLQTTVTNSHVTL